MRLCGIWTIKAKLNEPWRRVEWACEHALAAQNGPPHASRAHDRSQKEPPASLGVTSEPRALVAGAERLEQAARPRLNNEAGGDDLATMETKINVLAGDVSTEEGERSSGKVQQLAV